MVFMASALQQNTKGSLLSLLKLIAAAAVREQRRGIGQASNVGISLSFSPLFQVSAGQKAACEC